MRITKFFEQLFFPIKVNCNICKREDVYKYGLCRDCYDFLKKPDGNRCDICMDKINTEGLCSVCFNKKPDYTKLYCAYVYDMPLRMLIIGLKNSNRQYLKYSFAEIALDTVPEDIMNRISLITAVPSSDKRLKDRGYNQAKLIAKEISALTHIPYSDTLTRIKDVKTALMNKEDRLKSIKGQYYFTRSVAGETVLLVDDVCTTGSTLRECAGMLKKAGAEEIFCFTVARTDLKN